MLDKHITDKKILTRVLFGLLPSIKKVLPNPFPTTLDQLFVFAEKLPNILPPDDDYWGGKPDQLEPVPDFSITISNDLVRKKVVKCYRCLGTGHYAGQCKQKRVSKKKKRTCKNCKKGL